MLCVFVCEAKFHYVALAGLEFTGTCLPLPPECCLWIVLFLVSGLLLVFVYGEGVCATVHGRLSSQPVQVFSTGPGI